MSRLYDIFDELTAHIGASLVLSDGDTVVQTSANVNAHRCARGTIYQSDFVSAIEGYIYSPDGSNPSLATVAGVPPLLFGLVTSAADKAKYVGEDTHGVGWAPDGDLYVNNASVGSFASYTYKDYLKIILDKPNESIALYKNGSLVGSYGITSGQSWTFAATVSNAAGKMAVKITPGNPPMRYPSADLGWWTALVGITPVQVATEPYMTAATDTPRHDKYDGDLDNTNHALAISDSLHFWTFGASAPAELGSGGLVQFQINDPTRTTKANSGKYGRLLDPTAKGSIVSFAVTQANVAYSGSFAVFTGYFDHAVPDTFKTIQCYARSFMERLNIPLRRALFPPTALSGLANLPEPMMLSICRNHEPPLEAIKAYAMNDAAVTGFGINRLAGKPMVLGTDYNITPDSQGITTPSDLQGKITLETTSTGTQFDPGAPDYLTGEGQFDSATPDGSGHPTGWTAAQLGYSSYIDAGWQVVTGGVKQHNEGANLIASLTNTDAAVKIKAGRSYAYKVVCTHVPQYGSVGGVYNPVVPLLLCPAPGFTGEGSPFATIYLTVPNPLGGGWSGTFTYEGTFTSTQSVDRDLSILLSPRTVGNNIGGTGNYLLLKSIVLNELPPISDNMPLPGLGLTAMINNLAVVRGPLSVDEVDTTQSDAIDTATGYLYGLAVKASENPTVADCLQRVLDSCTASGYFDGDGNYTVFRLSPPEDVADVDVAFALSYAAGDFLSDLVPYADLAEGLTTRASGTPNISPATDGDFGSTSLADCDNPTRAKLKRAYQVTQPAGVALAAQYLQAYQRKPHETVLDRAEDILDMIVHANTYYKSARFFYVGDVWMPPVRRRWNGSAWVDAIGDFKLGTAFDITYPIDHWTTGTQRLWLIGFSPKQPSLHKCKCIFAGL